MRATETFVAYHNYPGHGDLRRPAEDPPMFECQDCGNEQEPREGNEYPVTCDHCGGIEMEKI